MKREGLATFGSVASAAASSACCWLPLIMVATGFSAVGASAFFDQYRPIFLVVAVGLLGVGFYLNYRPQKILCEQDGECAPTSSRLKRLNLGMLWTSTALVAALAMFPSYVGRVFGANTALSATELPKSLVLSIDGMTCTGCEVAVETALNELAEISGTTVSYEEGNAIIQLLTDAEPSRFALAAAVGKAGYKLASVSASEVEPAQLGLSGHWLSEIKGDDGEDVPLIMDLGMINSRWVGEFDLIGYRVENYPVEVRDATDEVHLYLTAIGTAFEGALSSDGMTLEGTNEYGDGSIEKLVFRRDGEAKFSDGFLELEAAADDPSVIEKLSDNGAELRELFNADVDKTRLLMLLAPT